MFLHQKDACFDNKLGPTNHPECTLKGQDSAVGKLARQDQKILGVCRLSGRPGSPTIIEKNNEAARSAKAHQQQEGKDV